MKRDLLLKVRKGKIILIPFPKINQEIEEEMTRISRIKLEPKKKR